VIKKLIFTLTAFLFFILIFHGKSFTQTKVGYIDSKKIIDVLQEARDAKSKLDNLVNEWQSELKLLQDSLKNMKEDLEKKKLILTEQLKQQKEKEITDLDAAITAYKAKKFGEGGEYYQKQIEFMKPVYDIIFNAIQIVAKDGDYDYVFDRSSDLMLLYVNEKYDLTLKVLKIIQGK
jgi:outer membrane protein